MPAEAAAKAGLDSSAPLRDSGIPWLGDIPAHWDAVELRRVAAVIDCKHRTVPFVVDGIPLASIREVQSWEVDLSSAKMTTEDEYSLNRHVERPSPDLLDTLYICQQRQEWYRDFARSEREAPLSFVGSVALTTNVEAAAARIRTALGFDVEERRRMPTWTDALRRFIEQADAAGVLVMVSGVVGNNNRRKLDPDEFRGFALADDLAPLVFINGADSKSAQMFTLAHELAHIWLGQSALSDVGPASSPSNEVEIWCNRVAAELLVPLGALRHENRGRAELREEPSPSAWVSRRFARALIRSTFEGQTSFTEAFRMLGLKKMSTFRDLGESIGASV